MCFVFYPKVIIGSGCNLKICEISFQVTLKSSLFNQELFLIIGTTVTSVILSLPKLNWFYIGNFLQVDLDPPIPNNRYIKKIKWKRFASWIVSKIDTVLGVDLKRMIYTKGNLFSVNHNFLCKSVTGCPNRSIQQDQIVYQINRTRTFHWNYLNSFLGIWNEVCIYLPYKNVTR